MPLNAQNKPRKNMVQKWEAQETSIYPKSAESNHARKQAGNGRLRRLLAQLPQIIFGLQC